MKKIFFISILSFVTIIIGSLCSQTAFALTTPNGERAFTIEELMSLGSEFEKELKTACGSDYECEQELRFTKIESDGRYMALDNFYQTLFLITSVNPAEGTMKVFYHSKNGMLRWIEDDLPDEKLTKLRIGWSEPGAEKPVVIYGYIPTDGPLLPEGFHFIYSGDTDSYEPGWIPADTEFTINSPDSHLELIADGLIQAEFYTDYSNSAGWTDISDCINSPHYEPGLECKAVFTEQSLLTFVPFKDGVPAYNVPSSTPELEQKPDVAPPVIADKAPSTVIIEEETYTEPIEAIKASYPAGSQVGGSNNPKSESNLVDPASKHEQENETIPADSNFAVPLGGGNETTSSLCYSEFPWWLVAVILAIDVIILWFFYPKRKTR